MAISSRLFVLVVLCWTWSQLDGVQTIDQQCPPNWLKHQNSCYKFEVSPTNSRNDARRSCLAYGAELVSVDDFKEYEFLKNQLLQQDSQYNQWYVNGKQTSQEVWINDMDNKTLLHFIEKLFLPEQYSTKNKGNYVAFKYSVKMKKWVLEKVFGDQYFPYICETYVKEQNIAFEDNFNQYGYDVDDPLKVPRGPFFTKQPSDVVFDNSRKSTTNDITMTCRAGGYPTPTYEWFKEEYDNEDKLVSSKVDPLENSRFTLSGGSLIIYAPKKDEDKGRYYCKATNRFGSIISETVELSFGFIGEFNLQRPFEQGTKNWGKTIFCDPPQYFPSVRYFWVRDSFPNFVQEDRRVFISSDGYLYFSSLEEIDAGNYSCNVQSKISNTGKNGPLFPLHVVTHSDYQKLTLPNNFPKVFPEAPVAGHEVQLECVAFAYPLPSYNWTRKGAPLPKSAYLTNYNRVLIIPQVQMEDQGEYTCHVSNEHDSNEKSIFLTIQAEPKFTIPLTDKYIENQFNLTWTCEAFGVPKVTYKWFKNGEPLEIEKLQSDDQKRYSIENNVLNIKYIDIKKDLGMYQCQAQNTLKKYYSSAQLRVLAQRPLFKNNLLKPEVYAAQGKNVTVECNPVAAPKPEFVWTKDGHLIKDDVRYTILENGNLVINQVEKEDEGYYTCIAHNMYGTGETQKRLLVMRNLVFIEQLKPQIRSVIKKDILLRCKAVTDEILEIAYIWTHNDMPLRDSNLELSGHVHINGEELYIRNLRVEDSGEYKCIARSVIDEISSATTLSIDGPPGPPGGVFVEVKNTSAKLRWANGAANGCPITHYTVYARTQWNNTWLKISSDIVAKNIYNDRKEAFIENVLQPWSTYEFRIAAGNELGFSKASLPSPQVNTPADHPYKAPANITGGGGRIGDLTIKWKKLCPQDQNGPGIYYKVYWRRFGYETDFQFKVLQNFGNIGMTVVHIEPEFYFTKYEVKVQAFNELGAGPISEPEIIYSAEDMPQVAPHGVISVAYNSTAINVSWTPIDQSRELLRGQIIGYRFKYWRNDGSESEENALYYLSRSTKSWALILGLQPNTEYNIKVMAYNSAGEGPESERSIERTFNKAPQTPPTGVVVEGLEPDTIRVTFRYVAANPSEESIYGFKVRIWEYDQDISSAEDIAIKVGTRLEVYAYNLIPGKKYKLRVLAYSKGGDGRMSSPVQTFQMANW